MLDEFNQLDKAKSKEKRDYDDITQPLYIKLLANEYLQGLRT